MTAASGRAVGNSTVATVDWAAFLKDAVIAAMVATLLALPLVGVETYDVGGGALGIRTHFDRVAIAAAAVFAGRLALQIRQRFLRRGESRITAILSRLTAWGNRQALRLTIAGIAFAAALPFLPFSSRYLIDLATTVLIYVMLGWISATSRSTPSVLIPLPCRHATWGLPFGRRCRSRAWWQPASGLSWAFRCCGCEAIISRSSPSASAKSSA